jgi:hypothetical protein
MAYKKFSDFVVFDPPDVSDYLVGYRELGGEFRSTIQDLTLIFKRLAVPLEPYNIYISLSGNDSESGTSDAFSLRTIKRGLAKAFEVCRNLNPSQLELEQEYGWGTSSNPVTVYVKSGEYYEDNPIYVPPGVTVVGDNVKSVTVIPKNKFYDIFWVNNQTSIQNIEFKDYFSPAYAVAYPEFGYLTNTKQQSYPSTRLLQASAKAVKYYYEFVNNPRPFVYDVSKKFKASFLNFSKDSGTPIFDPFEIAFLGRYFRDLSEDYFYKNDEKFEQLEFWQTEYFNLSSSIQKPYVLYSPYLIFCSSKTRGTSADTLDAGGGVIIDGDNVDGPFRSMTINSFNHFNQGGTGINVTNNGSANIKNNVFLFCKESVKSDFGGTCFVNGCNSSYGLSGLVAIGQSAKPTLVGQLSYPLDLSVPINKITVTNLGSPTLSSEQLFANDIQPYVGQVFSIVDEGYLLQNIGVNYLSATNSGMYFEVLSASRVKTATPPHQGYECDIIIKNYLGNSDQSIVDNVFVDPIPMELEAGSKIKFFIRSNIAASSQSFDTVGSGVNYSNSKLQDGGIANKNNEVVFDKVGRVFYNSTDENGNFKIGKYFNYDQMNSTLYLGSVDNKNSVRIFGNSNLDSLSSRDIIVENLSAYDSDISNANISNLFSTEIISNSLSSNNIEVNTLNVNETLSGSNVIVRNISIQDSSVSPVSVIDATDSIVFADSDNSKIFNFDTSSNSLSAIFPATLKNGFNVVIMNVGTNYLYLSAPNSNYKSSGKTLYEIYDSAYVFVNNQNIYAIGKLGG